MSIDVRNALRRFLIARWPELLLVLLGVGLRVSMLWTFSVHSGYDYPSHWSYIEWLSKQWTLPAHDLSRTTFHPPLFYAIGAVLIRLKVPQQGLLWISIVSGCVRLVIIWIGLERLIPERRLARRAALFLLAVFPPSVHLDGMANGEALGGLLSAVAMLFTVELLRSDARGRWRWAVALGVASGLSLLAKISGLTVIAAFVAVALVEAALRRGRERLLVLAPWAVALVVAFAVSGWYFVRNQRLYGHAFLSSFEAKERGYVEATNKIPYLDRRPLGFFVGWSNDIYASPYWPAAVKPHPRLFPMILASSFVDYYNYEFGASPRPGQPSTIGNTKPLRPRVLAFSRVSVAAGTAIALATIFAWLAVAREAWRARRLEVLFLCLMPLLAVVMQTHFATKYPIDQLGMVKGVYLQFASPPLYGLFGLAVAWTWRRFRPGAVALLGCVGLVASYTIYCRLLPVLDRIGWG